MRIAYGYRNATHFRGAGFQDHLGLDRGFSHFSFKFELRVASGGQNADLGSRPGQDCDALFPLRGADVGGDAAGAVAGNLRWRAVGVDQTDFKIRRKVRRHPFHTVGANAIVPVANAAREGSDIGGRKRGVDQQKIVAARAGLDKGNGANGRLHSCSTRPRQKAL